jgi:hypothetical protein
VPLPWWVQAGWHYYRGWAAPAKYLEWNDPVTGWDYRDVGVQWWGTSQEYRVQWESGDRWCAYVDTAFECRDVQSAPIRVQALSEVHTNPQNELDTQFSEVQYLNAAQEWLPFDQALWREDAPYSVEKTYPDQYRNYGPH